MKLAATATVADSPCTAAAASAANRPSRLLKKSLAARCGVENRLETLTY
jgi:hypothetical protein